MLAKRIKKKRRIVMGSIKFFIFALPMFILSKILLRKEKYSNIWIISERNYQAYDNGYHFFKYVRKNFKNEKCFYVIDKKHKDYLKVKEYENLITCKSYKHYLYYFLASLHINTQSGGYGAMPNIHACRLIEILFKTKTKKIFIQHGVIQLYMKWLTKEKAIVDYITASTNNEADFLVNAYGYKREEVMAIGLCRFDDLLNYKTNDSILYIPTWREYLYNLSEIDFMKSDYYTCIMSLINSNELNDFLYKNGLVFKMFLHPNAQRRSHLFSSISSCVNVISDSEIDMQTLLKESKLLITDYSSVAFDFAYMKKPIIYYQTDYEKFTHKHYKKGYFDYKKNGFGCVVNNEKSVLDCLYNIKEQNFKLEEKYILMVDDSFISIDSKNCERLYKSLKKLGF